ncbi:esterase [Polystyrenella longa]|uniref:Esterase n=1 Tax=Polystyrenella longa TaxID=2528007 RepID=A0A518CJ57_9PLAN|nr:prolyl oligopeptidase family serine peptidase [Polystyrenella longa]QDU79227.1 esterase [Polystyrenella longa]
MFRPSVLSFNFDCLRLGLMAATFLFIGVQTGLASEIFTQHKNVVYAEKHGVALVMDIFEPKGEKNGYGLVDAISGAFYSDRGKLRDHEKAKIFDVMCSRGYVVFAVRPGSVSKFTAVEMLENLRAGFEWVNEHSGDYEVTSPDLGMVGASAGGYLACMTAVKSSEYPETKNLKAVGVFFPPTDFTQYGPFQVDVKRDDPISKAARNLFFPHNYQRASAEEVAQTLTAYSPAKQVTEATPPFLLIHGDADLVVPLQQSALMRTALEEKKIPVELVVKRGGGHPWPTISEEVILIADFFDKTLRGVELSE